MTHAAVRPEYEALARGFAELAAQLDVVASPEVERDIVCVCAAFEIIDRHVDDTRDAEERRALGEAIVEALRADRADARDDGASASALGAELASCVRDLRTLLRESTARTAFADALARFFVRTEALRIATRARAFVDAVHGEAQCAAEMALLACEPIRTPRFERFFRVLSDVGNLTDKLHDARGDARRGEIAIRAGVVLHVALLASFVARAFQLLWLTPRPWRIVAWGARYVLPPSPMHHPAVSHHGQAGVPQGGPPR